MAQLVKYFLNNHEDLSLNPYHPHKKTGLAVRRRLRGLTPFCASKYEDRSSNPRSRICFVHFGGDSQLIKGQRKASEVCWTVNVASISHPFSSRLRRGRRKIAKARRERTGWKQCLCTNLMDDSF